MDLTIAICVYNKEGWLEETLRSVMAQTVTGFDLLIVDDASTDGSVEAIETFFKEHPRSYKLVKLPDNRGIGYCRYFAERAARSRYLMFLDADDVLKPAAVERMWSRMKEDSSLMAVGCYLDYVDEKSHRIGGGLYLGETNKDAFFDKAARRKLIFMQPTAIYDREAALRVGGFAVEGFPEGKPRYQDFCEDLDLWTRMSDLYTEGRAIVVVPEVLALYRKAGSGLSGHTREMLLKMRWVKYCLIERREGRVPPTFAAWLGSREPEFLRSIEREARATDKLRLGAYRLHRRNLLGLVNVVESFCIRPSYLIDKVSHNLLGKKKK